MSTLAQKVALEHRHLVNLHAELVAGGEHELAGHVKRATRELVNAAPELTQRPEVKFDALRS
jgi:hypothetical protein